MGILEEFCIRHLAGTRFAPQLLHALNDLTKAADMRFRDVPAAGIDRQFAAELDPAVLHPIQSLAGFGETKALECAQHLGGEGIEHPQDIDVVLIMGATFKVEEAPRESRTLFSHPDAQARFGASVFWIREGMLSEGAMQEFLDTWQRSVTAPSAECWR